MKDADYFWAALFATGTAVEAWALLNKRDELTLSRSARRALRCHTPLGRAASFAIIGAGSSWLAHHFATIPLPPPTP